MQEQINLGKGEAAAIEAKAGASSAAIRMLAAAIASEGGQNAVSLRVAEQYVQAFESIAKAGNTVVVPANVGDAGAMVAQAMAVFKAMDGGKGAAAAAPPADAAADTLGYAPLADASLAREAPREQAERLGEAQWEESSEPSGEPK